MGKRKAIGILGTEVAAYLNLAHLITEAFKVLAGLMESQWVEVDTSGYAPLGILGYYVDTRAGDVRGGLRRLVGFRGEAYVGECGRYTGRLRMVRAGR